MELFKYLDRGHSLAIMDEIYTTIYSAKGMTNDIRGIFSPKMYRRAIKEYNNKLHAVDVMDDVGFHILTRYDSESGKVENFTNSIMSTIDKSKHEFEVANNDTIELKMEKAQYGESTLVGELPATKKSNYEILVERVEQSTNIKDCEMDIEECIVENYPYLKTGNKKLVKELTGEVLEAYSLETIQLTINYILHEMGEDMERVFNLQESANIRSVIKENLTFTPEDTVKVYSKIYETILLERKAGCHAKNIYKVDIQEYMDIIRKSFITSYKAVIKGMVKSYYLTLSGYLCNNEQEALERIEAEFVNYLLEKTRYKVIEYKHGQSILFSTTNSSCKYIDMSVYGYDLRVKFLKVPTKTLANNYV